MGEWEVLKSEYTAYQNGRYVDILKKRYQDDENTFRSFVLGEFPPGPAVKRVVGSDGRNCRHDMGQIEDSGRPGRFPPAGGRIW